jgi:hypothetical protein
MLRVLCAGLFAAAMAILAGCDNKPKPSEFKGGHDHDHSDHNRKDALLEDFELPLGMKAHAGLQAHLGAVDGNELDVFFESLDTDPKPLAIPDKAKVTARVTRKGDDEPKEVTFKPADKSERKSDPNGMCSRFSAEVKWMKADDTLTVTLTVDMDGKIKRVTFDNFVPKDRQH